MANDLNMCQFIGRLGNPPEVKFMPNGKAVSNFSIACGKSWKDQNGQKQERTEWIRCVSYGKLAEIIGEYLTKGSQIYISGSQSTRKWQDQQGQDRYTTEIIVDQMQMLGSRDSGQQSNNHQQGNQGVNRQGHSNQSQGQQRPQNKPPMAEPDFDFDDDIPF